jgi:predicted metalloprotease with PDZ domain
MIRSLVVAALFCLSVQMVQAEEAPPLLIEVDARQLPRRLVHTTIEVPCKAGELRLWYPKWYPGSHGPMGRLEDVGGLQVETSDGRKLSWERDDVELFCVKVQIPEGLAAVRVKMTTICNSPSVDAAGIYTYGNNQVGVINWNTCVLYPEGPKADDQPIKLKLKLPEKWKHASALKVEKTEQDATTFKTVSLTELIDNPLIAGEFLRDITLNSGSTPPAYMHIASDSADALKVDDKVIAKYSKLVQEAGAMFGVAHYPEFHFLVTCSDELGYFGLEHLQCSINGIRKRDLLDDKARVGWVAMLIPHEYVHSWCGKYRRPTTMITPNFHSPQRTKMLWVYEGLAQYLGDILMVRSGIVTPETYRDTLNGYVQGQLRKTGRNWRSLEDTSASGYLLRRSSPNWGDMRRDQDFYFEGMLLWMECDAIIREESKGKKSLDDFCKIFFASVPGQKQVVGYGLEDVVQALQQTQAYDWNNLLTRRVKTPLESLPLDFLVKLGYRMQYSDQPPKAANRNVSIAEDSLGLRMAGTRILTVYAGTPADKANLAVGMRINEVNGEKYSVEKMQQALVDSVKKKTIELQVQSGESTQKVTVNYGDGLRYRVLKRLEDKPDLFMEIYKPLLK